MLIPPSPAAKPETWRQTELVNTSSLLPGRELAAVSALAVPALDVFISRDNLDLHLQI